MNTTVAIQKEGEIEVLRLFRLLTSWVRKIDVLLHHSFIIQWQPSIHSYNLFTYLSTHLYIQIFGGLLLSITQSKEREEERFC